MRYIIVLFIFTTFGYSLDPKPTTKIVASMVLDSEAEASKFPYEFSSFNQIAELSNFQFNVEVFDSLGAVRELTIAAFKLAPFDYVLAIFGDSKDLMESVSGYPRLLGSTQLFFRTDGKLLYKKARKIRLFIPWNNGSRVVRLKLTNTRYFAGVSALTKIKVNGRSYSHSP